MIPQYVNSTFQTLVSCNLLCESPWINYTSWTHQNRMALTCVIWFVDSASCPWIRPTDRDDVLECNSGRHCNVKESSVRWGCCYGGRKRCPKNYYHIIILCDTKYVILIIWLFAVGHTTRNSRGLECISSRSQSSTWISNCGTPCYCNHKRDHVCLLFHSSYHRWSFLLAISCSLLTTSNQDILNRTLGTNFGAAGNK